MDEDINMDNQGGIRHRRRPGQGRNNEVAVACGSAGTGPGGQWDSATMTSPIIPASYISQPTNPDLPSSTSSAMAKPLGRTQTLGQIGRTESFVDVFSTPLSPDGPGLTTASTPSMLQHRESSAVLNDDDDDDERDGAPRIQIEVEGDDQIGDGTQPIPEAQDVSMGEPRASNPVCIVLFDNSSETDLCRKQRISTASKPVNVNLIVRTNTKDKAQRFPSPVPTEPEDPYPEHISKQLAKHHIKTRDFAWYPPHTSGAPPPSTPLTATNSISSPVPTPVSPTPPQHHPSTDVTTTSLVPLTPETFDPYKALGEFEFRLRQNPRTLAIPGKTLRRLVEIGWVTENEIESRCSADDLQGLEEFDSRNRARLLRLNALREQRGKDLGIPPTPATATGGEEEAKPGTGLPRNSGYTIAGAYPYITLRFESVPTFAEREELATGVRPLFHTVDRVIRMAMAMERERERDRQEAEAALMKRREEEEKEKEEEKERLERERCVREPFAMVDRDQIMRDPSNDAISAKTPPLGLQPLADSSPGTVNLRKRSPHQAWAGDENDADDDGIEDLEVKRLRLARSQSETWYEQERRHQQQQQQQESSHVHQASPSSLALALPHTHSRRTSPSPHKFPAHSRNNSNANSSHSRHNSQSQSQNFIPPEIQYPAPLSAYDPELYPDAAYAIESQSQQSQSQGRRHPHLDLVQGIAAGDVTPPASDDEESGDNGEGEGGKANGKASVGRGFGLNEDGEPDLDRPNALKRSPKKGVKRGLTRGRTLVQIC